MVPQGIPGGVSLCAGGTLERGVRVDNYVWVRSILVFPGEKVFCIVLFYVGRITTRITCVVDGISWDFFILILYIRTENPLTQLGQKCSKSVLKVPLGNKGLQILNIHIPGKSSIFVHFR